MDLENVPLRTSLRLLLKQVGLAFSLEKGVLHITAENQGETMGSGGGGMAQSMSSMMGGMMRSAGSNQSKGSKSTGGKKKGSH